VRLPDQSESTTVLPAIIALMPARPKQNGAPDRICFSRWPRLKRICLPLSRTPDGFPSVSLGTKAPGEKQTQKKTDHLDLRQFDTQCDGLDRSVLHITEPVSLVSAIRQYWAALELKDFGDYGVAWRQ